MNDTLLYLIILLPLFGSALIGIGGLAVPSLRNRESLIGIIGTLAVAIPFFIVLAEFFNFGGEPSNFTLFSWFEAANLNISFSYTLDELSILMAMIVNGVGALIHIYSIGYMKGDEGYYKFFAYLNLFIFAMNNLILGSNMVVMFLGWEGVGLCSYLLIGFWYTDMMNAKAAQKAFIANRIGDFAMLIAMFLVFQTVGSMDFGAVNSVAATMDSNAGFWIALLVFIAATGKSAQIPLFVWLPDAMAGPTPVSALIHAATMVTSGIYLIARMAPVFVASPEIMVVVAVVAGLTAIIAALIAIAQNDIKKVLAYSTVSQLGFMFMALGAGAFGAAIFHVMTHAFFKACLFLGSGSVIHAMEHMHTVKDPQDIRTMGGLRKYMPSTGTTFLISTLAISGIPLLSGFFSKDEILSSTFFAGQSGNVIYYLVFGVGLVTALLTAFYMTRLTYLTFYGNERFPQEKKPHESPAVMTIPLWILAILATVGGFLGIPELFESWNGSHLLSTWLGTDGGLVANWQPMTDAMHEHHSLEFVLIPLSAVIAILGVFMGWRFYSKNGLAGDQKLMRSLGGLYEAMESKFYFDEFYQLVIIKPFEWLSRKVVRRFDEDVVDGIVNGTGSVISILGEYFRRLQTGLVQNYAIIVATGVLIILSYLVFG